MVASFIKRIVQLSLWAPPSGIILTLPLVFNLLRKHPLCIQMIHKATEDSVAAQTEKVVQGVYFIITFLSRAFKLIILFCRYIFGQRIGS